MNNRLILQTLIVLIAIAPGVIKDTAAYTSQVIDTAEMSYGEFHTLIGATDIATSVFKVMGSDIKTDATTLGGTPVTLLDVVTKPSADDTNKIWVTGVDFVTVARPRYIQLQVTAGNGTAGTYLASTFVAMRDGRSSSKAADRGVGNAEYIGAA